MPLPFCVKSCFGNTARERTSDFTIGTAPSQQYGSETSSSSELGLEVQSTLLPQFDEAPEEEVLSTLSGIYISTKDTDTEYDYPAGFHFGHLTIPLTPIPKSALQDRSPKRRFDFFVSSDRLEEDVKQPLTGLCLLKCHPKYVSLIEDRRFVTVERRTGCKFAFDDETDPREILKLLKTRPHQPEKPAVHKISIFGKSPQQLAHAIAILSQELPSLMSHAVFKSRLLLGFSASNYYPIHGRMIFPPGGGQQKKRSYLSAPDNLMEREKYFHLKKPKKSKFIMRRSPEQTLSMPKFTKISEPKEQPLSLEDPWIQFCFEAGLQRPFSRQKSSDENFLEELPEKEAVGTTETTPLSTTKITSTSITSTTEPEGGSTETSSLPKISEMSLKSLEDERSIAGKGKDHALKGVSARKQLDEEEDLRTMSEVDENTSVKQLTSNLNDKTSHKDGNKSGRSDISTQEQIQRSANEAKKPLDRPSSPIKSQTASKLQEIKVNEVHISYDIECRGQSSSGSKRFSGTLHPSNGYHLSSNQPEGLSNDLQPDEKYQISSNERKGLSNELQPVEKYQIVSKESKREAKASNLQSCGSFQLSRKDIRRLSTDLEPTKKFHISSNKPKKMPVFPQSKTTLSQSTNKLQDPPRQSQQKKLFHKTSSKVRQESSPTSERAGVSQTASHVTKSQSALQSTKYTRQLSIDSKKNPIRFIESNDALALTDFIHTSSHHYMADVPEEDVEALEELEKLDALEARGSDENSDFTEGGDECGSMEKHYRFAKESSV